MKERASAKSRNACAIAKRPAARERLRALAIAVQPNTIGRAIYNRPIRVLSLAASRLRSSVLARGVA